MNIVGKKKKCGWGKKSLIRAITIWIPETWGRHWVCGGLGVGVCKIYQEIFCQTSDSKADLKAENHSIT